MAEALATLAMMFPESADRYKIKEAYWRAQEAKAATEARVRASGADGRREVGP